MKAAGAPEAFLTPENRPFLVSGCPWPIVGCAIAQKLL